MEKTTLITKPASGSFELTQVLEKMNEEGGFSISILTDSQGLTIASASKDGLDSEQQSAIVAIIQKTIGQVSKRLGMVQTDEISFYDTIGQRIVCRPFSTNSHELILAVRLYGKQKSFRRLTNQAMARIRNIWSQYWEQFNGIAR